MQIIKFILLLCLFAMLQACVNAAFTGAQAVYSRHSIQASLNDQYITMKAEREIYIDSNRFKNTSVSVSSFNGVVLITGQVNSAIERLEVEQNLDDFVVGHVDAQCACTHAVLSVRLFLVDTRLELNDRLGAGLDEFDEVCDGFHRSFRVMPPKCSDRT